MTNNSLAPGKQTDNPVLTARLNQSIDVLRLRSKQKKVLRSMGIHHLRDFKKTALDSLYQRFGDKAVVDGILEKAAEFDAYCHGHPKEEAKIVVMPTTIQQSPQEAEAEQIIEKPPSPPARRHTHLKEFMTTNNLEEPWYFDLPVSELDAPEEAIETFKNCHIETIGDFIIHDWDNLPQPNGMARNLWQEIKTRLESQGVVFYRNCENPYEVEETFKRGDAYWLAKPGIAEKYGRISSSQTVVAAENEEPIVTPVQPEEPAQELSEEEKKIDEIVSKLIGANWKIFLLPVKDFSAHIKSKTDCALSRFAQGKFDIIGQVAEQSRKDLKEQGVSDQSVNLIEKELNQVGLKLGYREEAIKILQKEKEEKEGAAQIQNTQNRYITRYNFQE